MRGLLGVLLFLGCVGIVAVSYAGEPRNDVVANLTAKADVLKKLEIKLEASGKFDTYADMRVKLVSRFIKYLAHDIANNRKPLTDYAARDLNTMIDDETLRIKDILAGKSQPMVSPRRVKDDVPVIVGSHLEQKVEYPDGRMEKRPVFLFGFGHFNRLHKDVEFLGSLGCNFCQTELGPAHVWISDGKWNQAVINRYKKFIKRADKAGVLVDLLLSPHYFPKWQYKKHPDWLARSGGFNKFSLDRPGLRSFLKTTFQREVKELSVANNFRTVCVMNEPVFFNGWADPDTRRMWEKYLKNKYGTIDDLNDSWETDYADWGNIPDYKCTPPAPLKPEPALYDWMEFNDRRFAGFIKWISDCVHETKTNKLTHAKEMGREFTPYNVMQGADVDLISRATDMAGNDWGCILSESDLGDDPQFALGYSIMRMASGHPIINTENHLIRGGTGDIRRNAVRAPFWMQAIYGLDASAAWSWEKWDKPEGDWTLGMWLYQPRATEEYVRTGLDLMRLMPDVLALRAAPCRVAVLHSRASALRYPKYAKYIKRTFAVLLQMGMRVEVVTENMIANKEVMRKLPDLKVLILPGSVYMPDKVYNNIKIMAANTGTAVKLIGVGRRIAKYNEFAQKRDVGFLNDTAILYQNIHLTDKAALSKSLDSVLSSFGVARKYTLIDNSTGKPARGVFYRVAEKNKATIATIVNMTYEPMICHWVDRKGVKLLFNDKLSLKSAGALGDINLPSLKVLCGNISLKAK